MREKIGQSLIVGLSGKSLTAEESDFLVRENIGGVILFQRNFENPQQLRELCDELQSVAKRTVDKLPFWISVDQEGGRVARFRKPFTVWPPMAKVGQHDSANTAFQVAQFLGQELRAVGVNMNFAPSLDILTNPKNTVIGDRAFGTTAEQVSKIGTAVLRGLIKADIIPVAKHFPGHGNTLLDSHEELPIEERTLADLMAREIEPFKKAFRSRLEFVMTSHILFKNIDPTWPCTLSEIFLKNILREQLRYKGVIVTDDLDMKALRKHHSVGEIAVRAVQAGAQILLYCNEPASPMLAIDALERAVRDKKVPLQILNENNEQICELKKSLLALPTPNWDDTSALIGNAEHVKLAESLT